jgi:outer membrane immunogenic protein
LLSAPPPAPAPVYNWTGWYVGLNAGASFGNAKTDFNTAQVALVVAHVPSSIPGFAGSDRTYPDGFMGGGQIGYNWQYSPVIVVGLEADFQGADEKASGTPFLPPLVSTNVTRSTHLDYQTKIDWFGTARARIGYVWGNGQVMSYVTGGLAYGRVALQGTSTVAETANNNGFVDFSITNAFGHSQVNTGGVVGYGTDGVIDFWGARNWTWKIEGLYMDLGHLDNTSVTSGVFAASSVVNSITGGQVATHTHFTDGILRGGLNYKFY